jgi:hypothetical protein
MIESTILVQALPATNGSAFTWHQGEECFRVKSQIVTVQTETVGVIYLWDRSFKSELRACRKLSESS